MVKLRTLLPAVAVVAACASGPSAGGPPASIGRFDAAGISAEISPFLDSFGAHAGEHRRLSGFVAAVADGGVLFARSLGYADRDTKAVADAETSFRIGSLTKQFTAVAILTLMESGQIRLDERITDVLPEYAGPNGDATVHQLLTHTAGVPNYTNTSVMAKMDQAHVPETLVKAIEKMPASFPAGTTWAYSNTHYILLGMMIEARTGTTYAAYMKHRLFDRAGLKRTVVGDAEALDNRAVGYSIDKDRVVPAPPVHMSVPWAAGGIRSTVSDLLRWDAALRSGLVVSDASLKHLYTPAPHASPYGPYAMGWIVREASGRRTIAHGGGINGFTTYMARVPADNVVVIAWLNSPATAAQTIAESLLSVVYGGPAPQRSEKPTPFDAATAAMLPGAYAAKAESLAEAEARGAPPGMLKSLQSVDVKLGANPGIVVLTPNGQRSFELAQQPDGRLADPRYSILVEVLTAKAAVRELIVRQGPFRIVYRPQR